MSFKSYEVLSTIISYNYSLMAFFDAFWDGKSMNYPTAYASTYGKVIFPSSLGYWNVFGICLFFLHSILLCHLSHTEKSSEKLSPVVVAWCLPRHTTSGGRFQRPKKYHSIRYLATTLVCVIFDVVNVVLFWIGTCMLSLSIPISSSFDIIPSFVAGILLFVTFLAGLAY